MPDNNIDFELIGRNGDTVFLLRPTSPAGREWLDENITDKAMWFGGGVAIEHRFVADVLMAIAGDELEWRVA
jgi:hypothetical protein